MQDTNNTYPLYGPDDIKRYLGGGMSAQEMHDMEKAALKDPLLADAMDGLKSADNKVTDRHLDEIKAAILGLKVGEAETPVVPLPSRMPVKWWRWAAAACILGAMAAGTWKLMQKEAAPGTVPIAGNIQELEKDTVVVSSTENITRLAEAPAVGDNNTVKQPLPIATIAKKENTGKNTGPIPLKAEIKADEPVKELGAGWSGGIGLTADISTDKKEKPATDVTDPAQAAAEISNSPLAVKKVAEQLAFSPEPGNNNRLHETASAGAIRLGQPLSTQNRTLGFHSVSYITGKITDETGNPVPAATLYTSGKPAFISNHDGSFSLPADSSSLKVSVSSVGYNNTVAILSPGRVNNIMLTKNEQTLNDVVIVGHGRQKKQALTGAIGDYRKFQEEAKKARENEVIYPEEGWAHFYQKLGNKLGVSNSNAKTLQIKFTVDDNGDPVDFEIVESPSDMMAKQAIELIKKAKWKNFKADKNAIVKIRLD